MYTLTSHGNMAILHPVHASYQYCFRPVLWLRSHHSSPHSPMYIHSYIYFLQSYWMLCIYNVCVEDCEAWWLPVGCSSVVLAAQTRPHVCSMPLQLPAFHHMPLTMCFFSFEYCTFTFTFNCLSPYSSSCWATSTSRRTRRECLRWSCDSTILSSGGPSRWPTPTCEPTLLLSCLTPSLCRNQALLARRLT